MHPFFGPSSFKILDNNKNPLVYFDVSIDGDPCVRMVFELFRDRAPHTAENFRALCTGETVSSKTGERLHYRNTFFHQIVKGAFAKAGDLHRQNGLYGDSIYGNKFPEEQGAPLKHDRRGLLSMALDDREERGSQFIITFKPNVCLNRGHIVFGKVIQGQQVLHDIEKVVDDDVFKTIKIIHCGELQGNDMKIQSPFDRGQPRLVILCTNVSYFGKNDSFAIKWYSGVMRVAHMHYLDSPVSVVTVKESETLIKIMEVDKVLQRHPQLKRAMKVRYCGYDNDEVCSFVAAFDPFDGFMSDAFKRRGQSCLTPEYQYYLEHPKAPYPQSTRDGVPGNPCKYQITEIVEMAQDLENMSEYGVFSTRFCHPENFVFVGGHMRFLILDVVLSDLARFEKQKCITDGLCDFGDVAVNFLLKNPQSTVCCHH